MMKIVEYKNKTLYFIPTAHVSKASVEEVKEVIESVQPQAVCIELDAGRAYNLTNKKEAQDLDIKTIIKQKKVGSFVASLVLSSYQKKIANDLDTEVGQEMKQAIASAQDIKSRVVYIDRDIGITLKRLWGNLSFWKKAQLATTLFSSLFAKEEVSNDEIESLKESDLLYESVKELDEKLPEVSQSILHERNYYMAEMIKRCYEDKIVIVIGAAHTEGIIEALDNDYSIAQLKQLPQKKNNSWMSWLIPIAIVVLLVALTFNNPSDGYQNLLLWLSLSSGLSTLGALLVGSHPATIITTFLGAPIGVLNPFLAVGMFASLVEAYFRPPTLSDFNAITEDASSFRMWFKNRALRIFLIFIVTNALSSLGTFIAGGNMIKSIINLWA